MSQIRRTALVTWTAAALGAFVLAFLTATAIRIRPFRPTMPKRYDVRLDNRPRV